MQEADVEGNPIIIPRACQKGICGAGFHVRFVYLYVVDLSVENERRFTLWKATMI